MLQPTQWRDLVVKELNGGELLQANIEVLWKAFDQWAARPYTQYLYTKRAAIDFLLGNLDEQVAVQVEGDLGKRLSERTTILLALRQRIDALLARAGTLGSAYVVDKLTRTAPVMPGDFYDPGLYDANGPIYQGDPYATMPFPLQIPRS
jgi:hypothetical protein